jgi:hypothetical protein
MAQAGQGHNPQAVNILPLAARLQAYRAVFCVPGYEVTHPGANAPWAVSILVVHWVC